MTCTQPFRIHVLVGKRGWASWSGDKFFLEVQEDFITSHFLFIRSEILVVRIGLVELFGSNRVIKHVFQFEQCKINCIAVGDIIQYHTRRYVNVINFHNDNLSTLENLMCSFRFLLKKTVFDVFCILDSSLELLKEMCVQ